MNDFERNSKTKVSCKRRQSATEETYESIQKHLIVLGSPECGLEVRDSLIPGIGKGLFVTRSFAAGEPITEYTGELITHEEAKKRRALGNDTHIIRLLPLAFCIDGKRSPDGKLVITDPQREVVGRGVAAFVNENPCAAQNNVEFDFIDSSRNLAVFNQSTNADTFYNALNPLERIKFIRAVRDIASGEELYASYGTDYWKRSKKRKLTKKAPNTVVLKHGSKTINLNALPSMKASGSALACHEVHTFMILKKSEEDARDADEWFKESERIYKDAGKEWNRLNHDKLNAENKGVAVFEKMSTPVLALMFRKDPEKFDCDSLNKVVIFQSARHISCNDKKIVVEQQNADMAYFESKGFTVVRQKIEVLPGNIPSMPQNAEEASVYPSLYFECHIKVELNDPEERVQVTDEEVARLVQISKRFTKEFGIPIPLSYNVATTKRKPLQRYLNVRFQGLGVPEMKQKIKQIREAIAEEGTFRHVKDIFEGVWADSNRAMDYGWIDGVKAC